MLAQLNVWSVWCLLLVIGFGGCIGSFINVIIYRLPRNMPLGRPRWSFCPNCTTSIRWYDNIPVISYFKLKGHCRTCGWPIPPRYVVVEVITLLIFLMLFDVFFVASGLDGVLAEPWASAAYCFASDWPIFAAHALLFACLFAMSVIDMEHYWLDIRFTHFAALCGFVFHALWTPLRRPDWPRPDGPLGGAAILAVVGVVVTHSIIAWRWRARARAAEAKEGEPSSADTPTDPPPVNSVRIHLGSKSLRPSAWIAGLALALAVAMLFWGLAQTSDSPEARERSSSRIAPHQEHRRPDSDFVKRVAPSLAFVFCALIAGSIIKREADDEIEEALEAERHDARKVVLIELAALLPTMALFVGGIVIFREGGPLEGAWDALWHWRIGRETQPLLGLGTAATGFIIGGATGWAVRIFFTLGLGKEAFGVGDIHIMAAAGAVVGWEVVLVGFFLSALLALLGKVLTLPFKRGHALPMGPWLTMGMFVVLLWRGLAFEVVIDRVAFAYSTLFGSSQ